MPAKLDSCVQQVLSDMSSGKTKKPSKMANGQPIKTDGDLRSVAFAMCNARIKAEEESEAYMLEGVGPVILGIAATNRPHLPLDPMSVIDVDGSPMLRVPIVRKGIYRHPRGKLVFNDKVFERMVRNHEAGESHFGVSLDIRHKPELGALAWFDKDRGGRIEQEGDHLVAYGKPTSEEATNIVKHGQYSFASIEFHPNYEKPTIEKLSADDLDQVTIDDLVFSSTKDKIEVIKLFNKEATMPKMIKFGATEIPLEEADDKFLLSQEGIEQLQAASEEIQSTIGKSDEKVTSLEEELETAKKDLKDQKVEVKRLESEVKELKGDELPEVPEEVRLRLEALETENQELNRVRLREKVAYTLQTAERFRDDNGRAHSPVLLNLVKSGLMLESYKDDGNGVIELEDTENAPDIVTYYRNILTRMLETIPGQMPAESNTSLDDNRMENASGGITKLSAEELEQVTTEFWEQL